MLAEGAKVTQVSARGGLSFARVAPWRVFPRPRISFRSSTGAEVATPPQD